MRVLSLLYSLNSEVNDRTKKITHVALNFSLTFETNFTSSGETLGKRPVKYHTRAAFS